MGVEDRQREVVGDMEGVMVEVMVTQKLTNLNQ